MLISPIEEKASAEKPKEPKDKSSFLEYLALLLQGPTFLKQYVYVLKPEGTKVRVWDKCASLQWVIWTLLSAAVVITLLVSEFSTLNSIKSQSTHIQTNSTYSFNATDALPILTIQTLGTRDTIDRIRNFQDRTNGDQSIT